jgi:uncharacterized protein YfaT (DUF1175 family)
LQGIEILFTGIRIRSAGFAVRWLRFSSALRMTPKAKSRMQRLILACVVAFAVLLLLLRLFVFVHGHGRRGVRGAERGARVSMAATARPALGGPGTASGPWTDRFGDGTPDFLRLTDPADQAAFRQWFTLIADYQAIRPKTEVPPEITDCASLLRFSYREALKRHDDSWFLATGIDVLALPAEIRAWRYPNTPLGAALFRVRPGSFEAADTTDGAFAQFADARTLVERNAYLVSRDVRQAQPGDLLFFRQFGQSSPWHSMILVETGPQARVVYHTGPDHGSAGELRRVLLAELLDHPRPQWRPLPENPNFLGVYRWDILRGTL